MDKLPKGWRKSYVEDVALNIQYGYTGKTIDNGEFRYLRITDIQNNEVNWDQVPFVKIDLNESKKYILKGNDIVFARTGATAGKSFLIENIDIESVFASYLIRIIPDLNKIYPKYLYLYFQSPEYWLHILGNVEGAAQPNFNGRKLARICFPLPPLPEQTRIVNKLDSLFERIDKSIALLEENIKHTEALMASVLDEVFEQAENNKKFEIKLLKDAVRVINGRAYKQQELLNEGKYPVIRVGNFFSNRSWYYSDLELVEDKYCDNGDLLYAWSASFGPKIWDGDRSIFHYHIWKMEIISPNLLKDYLYYMLLRDTEKIKSEGGRGVGMIHITKGDIEVRKITLPPLVNQNQIVDKIKVLNQNLEKLLTEQQSKLNYLKALKASLLDKAFKGEL